MKKSAEFATLGRAKQRLKKKPGTRVPGFTLFPVQQYTTTLPMAFVICGAVVRQFPVSAFTRRVSAVISLHFGVRLQHRSVEPALHSRHRDRFAVTRRVRNALDLNVLPSRPTEEFVRLAGVVWVPDNEDIWSLPL
jgi:hypothetical protein